MLAFPLSLSQRHGRICDISAVILSSEARMDIYRYRSVAHIWCSLTNDTNLTNWYAYNHPRDRRAVHPVRSTEHRIKQSERPHNPPPYDTRPADLISSLDRPRWHVRILLTLLSFPFIFIHYLRFDFTMCNPPFYSSVEEVASLADAKQMAPNAVCTGAHVETITPGGECAFVSQMVRESLEHRTHCRYEVVRLLALVGNVPNIKDSWYTSMLGRMSSVFDVVAVLRQHEVGCMIALYGQNRRH
jgi:hypothetical protein